MIRYELINPSDAFTFVAASREAAALTVFLISTGYGAREEHDNEDLRVPIFIFGGADDWYLETFGRSPTEGLDALAAEVIAALESFVIGDFRMRNSYELELKSIDDPEKRDRFIAEWNDTHRTSLNDISASVREILRVMRMRYPKNSVNVHPGES